MTLDRDYIAKKAGVSPSTVSRVFNYPSMVDSSKVKAVLAAAKKYSYSPNKTASALRRKGTGIISFVEYLQLDRKPVNRDYSWCFADSIRGAKRVIDKSMYNFNIINLSSANSTGVFNSKFCDGIIAMEIPRLFAKRFKASGIPYVLGYREKSKEFNSVYIDERAGGRLAGERFVATGHKKSAHITSGIKEGHHASTERYLGFKEGLGYDPLLIEGNYGIKGGFEAGRKIAIDIKNKRVDSIFVVNDITAFGVIQALTVEKIRIPEDVSLIGYDNVPYLDSLPFRLTTIETPLYRAYNTAATELLRIIKEGGNIYEVIIPDIILGNSVVDRR